MTFRSRLTLLSPNAKVAAGVVQQVGAQRDERQQEDQGLRDIGVGWEESRRHHPKRPQRFCDSARCRALGCSPTGSDRSVSRSCGVSGNEDGWGTGATTPVVNPPVHPQVEDSGEEEVIPADGEAKQTGDPGPTRAIDWESFGPHLLSQKTNAVGQ